MAAFFRRLMSGNKITAREVLERAQYPSEWPFNPDDFGRMDETSDSYFYNQPRVGVYHIDDQAIRALTRFYADTFTPNADILDLCSSWVSHIPDNYTPKSLTILGMNQEELDANPIATKTVVQNLNIYPTLPFPDDSFDIVTNVVSVDYLTKPRAIFEEMGRVLRPGGRAIMSFSNRCFPTKVVNIWGRTTDLEHVFIVGCYFHYSGAFQRPIAHELNTGIFGLSDPMYIVEATAL